MVEAIYWVFLLVYVVYFSQVVISLIYWLLCLIPKCITFKKPLTKEIKSMIKLDFSWNILRILWCFSYVTFRYWGTIPSDAKTGIEYISLIFVVVSALRFCYRDARVLEKDYDSYMPDFTKYFYYGLFSYYRFIRSI